MRQNGAPQGKRGSTNNERIDEDEPKDAGLGFVTIFVERRRWYRGSPGEAEHNRDASRDACTYHVFLYRMFKLRYNLSARLQVQFCVEFPSHQRVLTFP